MTTSDPSQTTATHNEIAQANVPFCSVQELQKKWNTTMKVPPKSASSILLCCFKIAMSYSQNRQDAYCSNNTRYAIIVTLRGCALDKGFSAPLKEYLFVGLKNEFGYEYGKMSHEAETENTQSYGEARQDYQYW
jgi:hypothetical protein